MKFAILFATCALTYAQTGPTGTWRSEEGLGISFPWEAVFKVDGLRLIGAVNWCSSGEGAFEISEGKIDGNTVTFKCKIRNDSGTITFTGGINGEEIAFTAELQLQDGGTPPAPRRFTAKRVRDAADEVAEMADYSARIHRDRGVTFDRILHADREPENWLTYSGTERGQHYSPLTQITRQEPGAGLDLASPVAGKLRGDGAGRGRRLVHGSGSQ